MRPLLVLFAVLTLSAPVKARAESLTVVVTPPHVKGRLDHTVLAGIVAELEDAFRAEGWRVTGLDEAMRLPVPSAGPCNNNTCALAYADAAHTSTALQLSVFGTSSLTFSLALVQPPGDAFVHGGAFDDPSRPAESISAATKDLIAQHARGAGPWLIVQGTPLDAAVRLDGDVIGVLPLKQRISGGEHVLVVSADGYEDYNNTIWLDNVAGAVKEVSVNLAHVRTAATAPRNRGERQRLLVSPTPLDWLLGGAATAAGMAYLAAGLVHHLEEGECLEERNGSCTRSAAPKQRTRTQLVAGASATAFGLGWLVVAPFARWVTPSASRTEARLTFNTEF